MHLRNVREQVFRQTGADCNQPLQVGFKLSDRKARVERERHDVDFNLNAQVAVGEQVFHHLCVADIIGEFFVRRANAESFGKLGGLELDVLIAEHLGDFEEEILSPDGQVGERCW